MATVSRSFVNPSQSGLVKAGPSPEVECGQIAINWYSTGGITLPCTMTYTRVQGVVTFIVKGAGSFTGSAASALMKMDLPWPVYGLYDYQFDFYMDHNTAGTAAAFAEVGGAGGTEVLFYAQPPGSPVSRTAVFDTDVDSSPAFQMSGVVKVTEEW
jgi:hypothetical protein